MLYSIEQLHHRLDGMKMIMDTKQNNNMLSRKKEVIEKMSRK